MCNSRTESAGSKGKHGGAIAALSRDGDIIPAPEAGQEPCTLRCCWLLRQGDHTTDVWITRNNSGRIGECQHVDRRTGPCAAQAPNQRCGQQQVAKPTQGDHKDTGWHLGHREFCRPCRPCSNATIPRGLSSRRNASIKVVCWLCS